MVVKREEIFISKAHFNKLTVNDGPVDGNDIINELEASLAEKTNQASLALNDLRSLIVNSTHDDRALQSCCTYNQKLTKFSTGFNAEVNFNDICEYAPTSFSSEAPLEKVHLLQKQEAVKTFKAVFDERGIGSSRHLYYGGKDGYFIAYPAQNSGRDLRECKMFDPRYRPWYIDTINTDEGKEIILLIDYSFKMGKVEKYLKMVASQVLGIADSKDKIFLKLLPNDLKLPVKLPCLNDLTDAQFSVTNELKQIIKNTKVSDGVLTSLHLEKTFSKFSDPGKEKYFILVTSGDYTDPAAVEEDFQKAIGKWNCSVSINIILISDGDSGGLSNEIYNFHQRLEDLETTSCKGENKNQLIKLSIEKATTNDITIRNTVAKVFDSFYASHSIKIQSDDVKFVMPYDDYYGLGTMIDACTRILNSNKEFLGVLCVSYLKDELFGITTEFITTDNKYRFLIDDSGTTLVHPNYANPGLHEQAVRFDITNFETSKGFRKIYNSMKRRESNNTSIQGRVSVPSGLFGAKLEYKNYTYYWKKVKNSFFTIGLVISEKNAEKLKFVSNSLKSDGVYHRFDVYKDRSSFCRNGDRLAIKGSAFKIGDSAFRNLPNDSMGIDSRDNIVKLTNFFNGISRSTEQIKSVAMATRLKTSVQVIREIDSIWLSDTGEESQTINSRYVALDNGVIQMFPGKTLSNYDATVQPWYIIAHSHSDERKLFFTPPFSFSTKRLLTVSTRLKRIYKEHSEIAGVMGMDFELPYFKQILDVELSTEKTQYIKGTTIVISQSGFIVYHPDFLDKDLPFQRNIHLIEKEPSIAKSLKKENFMKKNYCIEYNNTATKVIWFYKFDHLPEAIRINSDCVSVWIVSIPNTNLLVLKIGQNLCKPSDCTCANKPLDGSLPECKSFDVKNSCECPCYVKNVCLSSLPPRNESLICRSNQRPSQNIDEEIDAKDLNQMDQCFSKECSKRTKLHCETVGCRFNTTSETCVEWIFPSKHQQSGEDDDDDAKEETNSGNGDKIGMWVGIVIAIVIFVLVIAYVIFLCRKKGKAGNSTAIEHYNNCNNTVVFVNTEPDTIDV